MEQRLSLSFPTRSLSLGSHRRRWPGSRHLLQVFLKQTSAGAPQLSSARCYLAGLSAHCLSQRLHIFRQRPVRPHCHREAHGVRFTTHRVLQRKAGSPSLFALRLRTPRASSWRGARLPAGALPGGPPPARTCGASQTRALSFSSARGAPGKERDAGCSLPSRAFPGPRAGVQVPAPCRQLRSPPRPHAPAGLTPSPHALTHWNRLIGPTPCPHPRHLCSLARTPPAGWEAGTAGLHAATPGPGTEGRAGVPSGPDGPGTHRPWALGAADAFLATGVSVSE